YQRLRDMHCADNKAAPRGAQHLDKDAACRSDDRSVAAGAPGFPHGGERDLVERQVTLDAIAVEQQLATPAHIAANDRRALIVPRVTQRVEDPAFHQPGSKKPSILPPQARPTSQACSFVTPKSNKRGLPSRIAASAASTTAPSTQPPETEPTIAPFSSTASLAPTGRGAEPQVVTTVASATPEPSSRQRTA